MSVHIISQPVSTTEIVDGTIVNADIGAAAEVAVSKLADGAAGEILSTASNGTDVEWAAPSALDIVHESLIDAKGDLIAGSAADTAARVAVGANGTVLEADSTQATGVKWGDDPIRKSLADAKGDIFAATAADTPARVAVGTDGKVLAADSGASAGVAWKAASELDIVHESLIDAKGDLIVGSAADTAARLAVGTNGMVPVANSGDTAGIGYAYPSIGGLTDNWRAVSPTILASTLSPDQATNGTTLADGQVRFVAVHLPFDATVTGVAFFQTTQGDTTADNNNKIGLYTSDGTTLTRVAVSADSGTMWEGSANSWQQVAFTGTYAAQAGLYFIAILSNWSAVATAPVIAASAPTVHAGINSGFTTGDSYLVATLAAQTDLDASEAWSGTAVSATTPLLMLY